MFPKMLYALYIFVAKCPVLEKRDFNPPSSPVAIMDVAKLLHSKLEKRRFKTRVLVGRRA